MGLDFGLAHQDENFTNANLNTCMDYTNLPASNQHPSAHDYEQLETIYAHLDNTDTYTLSGAATNFGIREVGKPAPQQGGDPGVGDMMADWGSTIHRDGKGRPDVFVRQLADGRTAITALSFRRDGRYTSAWEQRRLVC